MKYSTFWFELAAVCAFACGPLSACSSDSSPGSADASTTGDGGPTGSGGASTGGKSGSGGSTTGSGGSTAGSGGKPGSGGSTTGSGGKPGSGGSTTGSGGSATGAADAGSSDSGSADAGPMDVTIHFKATVGTAAFACGQTYTGQGSTKVTVEPRDFRFYIQSVSLLDENDEEVPVTFDTRSPWQTPDVALLDFEDGTGACAMEGNAQMNTVITGKVPSGKYSGVVFVNGVPDALNHGDPVKLPAPLQAGAMTWGWLYGYKFVKAELGATAAPAGDAEPGLGLVHMGSTGCDNTTMDGGMPDYMGPPKVACSAPNRNVIRLTGFDPAKNTIVADVGVIFGQIDLAENNQCHSEGTTCPTEFAALGVDFATGKSLTTQSAYHVE
ncbi:MAG TPA: MbnP family copper-binding protein [Polyangiaceae bacterium]|nr:MbnP family copper-binding protein [Polyangiaceae bacterium]